MPGVVPGVVALHAVDYQFPEILRVGIPQADGAMERGFDARRVEIVKHITCTALPKAWPWIIVPLDVDMELCPVDGSWAEKQKFKLN